MSLIAEFTMPPEDLPFGSTLLAFPQNRVEVERVIPTNEPALPFFWVWGPSPQEFVATAESEAHVSDTTLLDTVDNGALFRAEWSSNAPLIHGIQRVGVTILEAEGTFERWRFEVRARHRDAFVNFQEAFNEQGISVSLDRLFDLKDVVDGDRPPLTPEQRETLKIAYHEGYYESPRNVTQAELGAHFDISHRAVSDRLRRGTKNIIATTIISPQERL